MEHPSPQVESNEDEPACCPHLAEPTIHLEPGFASWQSALSTAAGNAQARASLGLDPDRPVVMSGHQPSVFHPGILAKLIALDEAARRTGAQSLWIIPDQDVLDPATLRLPTGTGESLSVRQIHLAGQESFSPGMASMPAVSGVPIGSMPTIELSHDLPKLLEPLVQWLDQFGSMETLGEQFGYGVIEYACDRLGLVPPMLVFASQLMDIDSIREVVDQMHADPMRCAILYNQAVARFPDVGVREMVIEGDRAELPVWGCRMGQPRIAIDSDTINDFAPNELVPRGLLMSALCRSLLADLFIHGLGGFGYDQISEHWFERWLGITLSPMAKVSADLRLDFQLDLNLDHPLTEPQAKWDLHHARHTPSMLGDDRLQAHKDQLVAQIEASPAKSQERYRLYRQLQALLDDYRQRFDEQLVEYKNQITRASALARQYELGTDRTWPMVCFSQESLQTLDRATRRAMGG
ncbi:MAG: hypothetical protein ACWA5W_09150 [Phycisphaerales bacterium]